MKTCVFLILLTIFCPGACPVYDVDLKSVTEPSDLSDLKLAAELNSEFQQGLLGMKTDTDNKDASEDATETEGTFKMTEPREMPGTSETTGSREVTESRLSEMSGSGEVSGFNQNEKPSVGETTRCTTKKPNRGHMRVQVISPKTEYFVGSNLFDGNRKRCFSSEDVALMTARKDLEVLIPKNLPKCLLSNEMVGSLMKYFHSGNQIIQCMPENSAKRLTEKAFYDTLGGYLKFYLLPMTKLSFYAGKVSMKTVEQVSTLYKQCKNFLNTYGNGWKDPGKHLLNELKNVRIEPLRCKTKKNYTDGDKYCASLDLNSVNCDAENNQMIVALPKLDSEDCDGLLGNIWLPFKEKRTYDLKSRKSAFIVVRFYETVTRCYKYKSMCMDEYKRKFTEWVLENIQLHLADDQLYPGLGAILRIHESRQRDKKSAGLENSWQGTEEIELDNTDDGERFLIGNKPKSNKLLSIENDAKLTKIDDFEEGIFKSHIQPKKSRQKTEDWHKFQLEKTLAKSMDEVGSTDDEEMQKKYLMYTFYIIGLIVLLLLLICCCAFIKKRSRNKNKKLARKHSAKKYSSQESMLGQDSEPPVPFCKENTSEEELLIDEDHEAAISECESSSDESAAAPTAPTTPPSTIRRKLTALREKIFGPKKHPCDEEQSISPYPSSTSVSSSSIIQPAQCHSSSSITRKGAAEEARKYRARDKGVASSDERFAEENAQKYRVRDKGATGSGQLCAEEKAKRDRARDKSKLATINEKTRPRSASPAKRGSISTSSSVEHRVPDKFVPFKNLRQVRSGKGATSSGGIGSRKGTASSGSKGSGKGSAGSGNKGHEKTSPRSGAKGRERDSPRSGVTGADATKSGATSRGRDSPRSGATERRRDSPRSGATERRRDSPRSGAAGTRKDSPRSGAIGRRRDSPRSDATGTRKDSPRSGSTGRRRDSPRSGAAGKRKDSPRSGAAGRGRDSPRSSPTGRGRDSPRSGAPNRGKGSPRSGTTGAGKDATRSGAAGREKDSPRSGKTRRQDSARSGAPIIETTSLNEPSDKAKDKSKDTYVKEKKRSSPRDRYSSTSSSAEIHPKTKLIPFRRSGGQDSNNDWKKGDSGKSGSEIPLSTGWETSSGSI